MLLRFAAKRLWEGAAWQRKVFFAFNFSPSAGSMVCFFFCAGGATRRTRRSPRFVVVEGITQNINHCLCCSFCPFFITGCNVWWNGTKRNEIPFSSFVIGSKDFAKQNRNICFIIHLTEVIKKSTLQQINPYGYCKIGRKAVGRNSR